MNTRNQRGEVATLTVVVIAVLSVLLAPLVLKGGNPFDRSADPSNRRTASEVSGSDIVKITNQVAQSDRPLTVEIDRSVHASAEVTDPKLTAGQKIGRFFSGLGTWGLVMLFGGIALAIFTPLGGALWKMFTYRSAFKNTVAGIRDIDDPEAYQKAVRSIAVQQNKRDKQLVDKMKSELH